VLALEEKRRACGCEPPALCSSSLVLNSECKVLGMQCLAVRYLLVTGRPTSAFLPFSQKWAG
jgi:hypothetical protein